MDLRVGAKGVEFNRRVQAWLDQDGLYLVNIIDGPRADFVRSYVSTLRQTFDYVYLAPTQSGWRETPRTTFVVVASDTPVDSQRLAASRADSPLDLEKLLLSGEELDALLTAGGAITLTDRYAPVDQMLAPAFRNEVPAQPAAGPGGAP